MGRPFKVRPHGSAVVAAEAGSSQSVGPGVGDEVEEADASQQVGRPDEASVMGLMGALVSKLVSALVAINTYVSWHPLNVDVVLPARLRVELAYRASQGFVGLGWPSPSDSEGGVGAVTKDVESFAGLGTA